MQTGFLLLTVFFIQLVFSVNINAQNDTMLYRSLIGCKNVIISKNSLNECWVLANDSVDKLYYFDANLKCINMTEVLTSATKSPVSGLLALKDTSVIVITKWDYAFNICKKGVNHINAYHGISDSSLLSVKQNKKTGRVFIEGTNNGFVSIDKTHRSFLKYTNSTAENKNRVDTIVDDEDIDVLIITPFSALNKYLSEINFDVETKYKQHIKKRQINQIRRSLEPCDILLKRENRFFTNNIIPGFWTHTAIYIGSVKTLNTYFRGLPLLHGMKPVAYIRKHYPGIYKKLLQKRNPVIEAVTSGVRISRLKKIAKVDYFAALRPDLSKEEKFLILLKAFEYYLLPYDYNFDFSENSGIVCSELVYKSFLPTDFRGGIEFKLGTLFGKPFMYPSDIVKQFDDEKKSGQSKLKFVLFYDCIVSHKRAFLSDESEFRNTWQRSRFDFLQK